MPSPCATQGDVKPRFSFFFIKGNQKGHHFEEFFNKDFPLSGFQDTILYSGEMPVMMLQFLHKVGIGEKPNIQDDVGVRGQPKTVTERCQLNHEPLCHRRRQEEPLNDIFELMDIVRSGVDNLIRHLP